MHTTPPMTETTASALAFGQPLWAPDESGSQTPAAAASRSPEQARPRGNGAVHDGDLARGEEQLGRVLGW
jgi:hypothetical protein